MYKFLTVVYGLSLICSQGFAQSQDYEQKLYDSLSVEEVYITPDGELGGAKFMKDAGLLICYKSGAVVPNPVYNYVCELKYSDSSAYTDSLSRTTFENLNVKAQKSNNEWNNSIDIQKNVSDIFGCTRSVDKVNKKSSYHCGYILKSTVKEQSGSADTGTY